MGRQQSTWVDLTKQAMHGYRTLPYTSTNLCRCPKNVRRVDRVYTWYYLILQPSSNVVICEPRTFNSISRLAEMRATLIVDVFCFRFWFVSFRLYLFFVVFGRIQLHIRQQHSSSFVEQKASPHPLRAANNERQRTTKAVGSR